MKFLFDFFPVLLFFIAFKLYGFYIATVVLMIASALQVGTFWLMHRKFETMHLIMLALVLLLGSATLLLHDEMFLKWKPTAVYWVFSLIFFGTQYIGKKPLIERMMEGKLSMPHKIWSRLNLSWGIFFLLMGIANLFVVYHYSTNAWVNFKLFGTLGLTILFVVLQAFYMARHIETQTPSRT